MRVPGFRSLRFLETLLYLPAQQKQSIDLMQKKKSGRKLKNDFQIDFLFLLQNQVQILDLSQLQLSGSRIWRVEGRGQLRTG